MQQARHAFASYPQVNILGVIIALGDCWTYREYSRINLSPSPPPLSESSRSDPKYKDSDSNSSTRALSNDPSQPLPIQCADVDDAFGASSFARLQTRISDNALHALQKRLRVLASEMFRRSGCNCSCCFLPHSTEIPIQD